MNNNILSHEDILDLLIPISNLVKRYKLDKDFLKLDSMSSFTISINDFTKKEVQMLKHIASIMIKEYSNKIGMMNTSILFKYKTINTKLNKLN